MLKAGFQRIAPVRARIIVGGRFRPVLPHIDPNKEDEMITVVIGIILGIFVLYGGMLLMAALAHVVGDLLTPGPRR